MQFSIHCAQCNNQLLVAAEHAGKKAECPKCGAEVNVPANLTVEEGSPSAHLSAAVISEKPAPPVLEVAHDVAVGKPRRCYECGAPVPAVSRRCPECSAWMDDEAERRPRRRGSSFVPCPKCGAPDPERVTFTWWGSFYGPSMFSHVRCYDCRYQYNGRTGRSNAVVAAMFVIIPLLLMALIVGGVAFVVISTSLPRGF